MGTPLAMNIFAFWMADNFLQGDPTKSRASEAEAHESFVNGRPSIIGQPRTPTASPIADQLGDDQGDESDRVLGFQEWKQRFNSFGRQHPMPTRIPNGQSGAHSRNNRIE